MTSKHQKHEILASLDALDSRQAERVLTYIKGLLYNAPDDASHQHLKREAMKEIRQALKGRQLGNAF